MDNVDEDIMSKVMKRRLGGSMSSCESSPEKRCFVGSTSSCESSPEKRLKSLGYSTHVLLQNENSLNKMNSFIQGFTSVKSPDLGNKRDMEGTDEIDGEVNKIDSNFGKHNSVKGTESNRLRDVIKDSHSVDVGDKEKEIVSSSTYNENQTDAAKKMLENCTKDIDEEFRYIITDSYGKYEYVLSGDDVKAVKPRIEMFSESDSNSNSNPFILSSFRSLNADNIERKNNDIRYKAGKETESRIICKKSFDTTSSSSAENSQEFGWLDENSVENTNSVSVSHKKNTTLCDVKKVGSDKEEYKSERSDATVVEDENLSRIKKESLVFNDLKFTLLNQERSENEEVRNNNVHTDESTRDSFIDSRSETGRSEAECEEMKGNEDSDGEHQFFVKSNMYHTDLREVKAESIETSESELKVRAFSVGTNAASKTETVEKSTVKKSRKQYVPKRVKKFKIPENDDTDFGFGLEAPEVYLDKDEVCCSEANNEQLNAEGSVELPNNDGVEHRKPEKSRKQFKPKRVEQSQIGNNQGLVLGNVNEEIEIEENDDGGINSFGEESKYQINETFEEVREKDTDNYTDKKYSASIPDFSGTRHHDDSVDSFSRGSDLLTETGKDKDSTESPGQKTVNDSNVSHFASLNTSPFYYGFSQNLDLISSLTPGFLQGPSENSGSFALNENGPENLEVIRQLREIRCNRYRKISMAEKREIAGYASAHGVSQAAAYYNVSKSAVSMWTKLDFSNIDEDTSRQKKNCMIGNEKFEALCNKVKSERENKFKGMTKQDKFEVSRYAKLVGVREMARCLDVALGTVSGWMRQFPYKVETESSDSQLLEVSTSKKNGLVKGDNEREEVTKFGEQNDKTPKRKKSNDNFKSNKKRKQKNDEHEAMLHTTVQKDDTIYILPAGKTDLSDTELPKDICDRKDTEETIEVPTRESDQDESSQQKDELDKMIAETWQKPDFDKCFEDIKDMIKDSPLEGDDFFRSLFERVIACRADKYKTLKPSEKLEVVRYAKRVGVRKVAKILGLATGTLSGWNTKYQSSLGITDPNIDMSNKSDLLVSFLSPDKRTESADSSSSCSQNFASLDNTEKSEVTAVKLLFKDKFPILLNKIRIAKEVKFRNITTEEKIEFVKCSKLVGIRPTARVFNIPIGTLSGWITKYTKTLHPAYHVDVEQDSSSNSQDGSSQFSPLGIYNPNVVGRTAAPLQAFHGMMNPAWQPMPGFAPSGPGVGLNIFPQFPNLPTSSSSPSLFPVSSLSSTEFSSPTLTSKTVHEIEHSRDSDNDKEFKAEEKKQQLINQRESWIVNESENGSENFKSANQSGTNRHNEIESVESESQSDCVENFEKEAREMAKRYLTATYEKMGIPIV